MPDNITVTGNVAADPEFKTTAAGIAIANFRVASAQRRFDRSTGAWVEDGTNWYSVSAFRGLAEHVAASITKGQPVIVTGRLRVREWDTGTKKGTSIEIDADAVGHDLRWGTTMFAKISTESGARVAVEQPVAGAAADAWAVPGDGHAAVPVEAEEPVPF